MGIKERIQTAKNRHEVKKLRLRAADYGLDPTQLERLQRVADQRLAELGHPVEKIIRKFHTIPPPLVVCAECVYPPQYA